MKDGDKLLRMINNGRQLINSTGEFTNRTVTEQILCWRFHDNSIGNLVIGEYYERKEDYYDEEMN